MVAIIIIVQISIIRCYILEQIQSSLISKVQKKGLIIILSEPLRMVSQGSNVTGQDRCFVARVVYYEHIQLLVLRSTLVHL